MLSSLSLPLGFSHSYPKRRRTFRVIALRCLRLSPIQTISFRGLYFGFRYRTQGLRLGSYRAFIALLGSLCLFLTAPAVRPVSAGHCLRLRSSVAGRMCLYGFYRSASRLSDACGIGRRRCGSSPRGLVSLLPSPMISPIKSEPQNICYFLCFFCFPLCWFVKFISARYTIFGSCANFYMKFSPNLFLVRYSIEQFLMFSQQLLLKMVSKKNSFVSRWVFFHRSSRGRCRSRR